jgi:uncharacterized protein (DUF1501 family)
MKLTRRRFLRNAVALGAYGTTLMHYLGRQALAGPAPAGTKKLLFIFLRGGNDGVNTVIPHGDSVYNPTNRPNLFIDPTDAIDLGNSFASLHPRMQSMMPIFTNGDLAIVHRVGYANQSRSHFDSQDYWEKGVPRNPEVKDGLFFRQLREMLDLADPANAFAAASIDRSALIGLKGETPFPNFTDSSDFNFLGTTDQQMKFLGELPDQSGPGKGMLGLYGDSPLAKALYADSVHATGTSLGGTIGTLADASGTYTPENGAVYPTGSFGDRLRECAKLFKRTEVRILGTDMGGFDNHSNQGAINGTHGGLLQRIADGFQALALDLQDQWNDLVIVTMTEFGRTSKENGSLGTDHAEASAVFLAGGAINGGVYNCDSGTWADGDMLSRSNRYVARKTDFRSIFGEVFTNHFGTPANRLDAVMPGYDQAVIDNPGDFTALGIM